MEENRNPKHEVINEETSKKEKPGYLKQNNIELFIYVILIFVMILCICLFTLINISKNLKEICISLSCSILGAVLLGLIFAIKSRIELTRIREESLSRIAKKLLLFYLYTIAPIYDEKCSSFTLDKYIINNIKEKEIYELIGNAKAYRRHLYDDLEKAEERLFKDCEWSSIRTSRVFLEIIPDWNQNMIGEDLQNLYKLVCKLDKITELFSKNIGELMEINDINIEKCRSQKSANELVEVVQVTNVDPSKIRSNLMSTGVSQKDIVCGLITRQELSDISLRNKIICNLVVENTPEGRKIVKKLKATDSK